MTKLVFVVLAMAGFLVAPVMANEKSPCKSKDNVLADAVVGTWVFDRELSERLNEEVIEGVREGEIEFKEDPTVASHKDFSWIEKKHGCVALSGYVTTRGDLEGGAKEITTPFVVAVTRSGTPAIWMYERPGRSTDVNPALSMLAKGSTKASDVLFIGGDHNNQPMTALVRKK